MSISRKPMGTPTGGQFAPTTRSESDIDLSADPSDDLAAETFGTPASVTPIRTGTKTTADALDDCDARPHIKNLGPVHALRALVDESDNDDTIAEVLPNLTEVERDAAIRDIGESLDKSERYSDPVAAEEAPSADQLVDTDDFVIQEQDRYDEDPYTGIDYAAYADELSEAWSQNASDRSKAAIELNDSRVIASTD